MCKHLRNLVLKARSFIERLGWPRKGAKLPFLPAWSLIPFKFDVDWFTLSDDPLSWENRPRDLAKRCNCYYCRRNSCVSEMSLFDRTDAQGDVPLK